MLENEKQPEISRLIVALLDTMKIRFFKKTPARSLDLARERWIPGGTVTKQLYLEQAGAAFLGFYLCAVQTFATPRVVVTGLGTL